MNKKIIIGIISAVVVVALAIGSFIIFGNSTKEKQSNNNTNSQNNSAVENNETSENDNENANSTSDNNINKDGKTLIVYFSVSGNTDKLAKDIQTQVGGDIVRIEPKEAYPEEYEDLRLVARKQYENDERPEIKNKINNIDDYDTVFIGYPIWFGTYPPIIKTFMDEYNLDGKTLIPFNTHLGSGTGGTAEAMQKYVPKAKVLDGLAVSGSSVNQDQTQTIKQWLNSLGL